jgi:hypothetical protein
LLYDAPTAPAGSEVVVIVSFAGVEPVVFTV